MLEQKSAFSWHGSIDYGDTSLCMRAVARVEEDMLIFSAELITCCEGFVHKKVFILKAPIDKICSSGITGRALESVQ